MSNEIQLYERITDPMAAVAAMGSFLAKSGMFGCENVEQGNVIALTCMTERMSPLGFKRKFHLVEGNPSMKADYMLGEFRTRGGKHRVLSRTAEKAEVELLAAGDDKWYSFAFTWEEAQLEPFVKNNKGGFKKNWATPRARKETLWARVISEGVHTLMPEVVAGVYTPEENGDSGDTIKAEINLTSAAPASPPKAESPKSAKVIDVAAELVEEIKSGLAPEKPADKPVEKVKTATPAPTEPKKETPKIFTAVADPVTGGIDLATVAKLMDVIPAELQGLALKKLVRLNWLKDGCGLETMSANHAQRVFNNVPGFLEQCKKLA